MLWEYKIRDGHRNFPPEMTFILRYFDKIKEEKKKEQESRLFGDCGTV